VGLASACGLDRFPFPSRTPCILVTWHGLPSLLSGIAATLSAVGRVQINQIYLRAWLLISAAIWLNHDYVVGSLPGMTADLLSNRCRDASVAIVRPLAKLISHADDC